MKKIDLEKLSAMIDRRIGLEHVICEYENDLTILIKGYSDCKIAVCKFAFGYYTYSEIVGFIRAKSTFDNYVLPFVDNYYDCDLGECIEILERRY